MATTSLWHIKGSLKTLLDYVENSDKVMPKGTEDFFCVFSYMQREDKTQTEYVTAVNCLKDIALQQMILTKKQYGKIDGYIAWHGYQSFKPGEVSAKEAHQIGVMLAKEMWGDRFQIIVTTHLDKDHLHNHFAFNSVSFRDGSKYNYTKAEQRRLREVSDKLCREHRLSVIEQPHKAPNRVVWLDEKSGKPTRYNVYRRDVKLAVGNSHSVRRMEQYLCRLGYITDFTGKHWKIRLPQYAHFTRLDMLNAEWTPQNICDALGFDAPYGNRRAEVFGPPDLPEDYRNAYTPHKPTSHIYRLYLYYCFQLGILPKGTDYRPTSPFLREELRKLDSYTAQTVYLGQNKIHTIQDLYADREKTEAALQAHIAERTKLQNRIRRAGPEEKEQLREEKKAVTAEITVLRKRLKMNYAIEERSKRIQDTLDRVYDNEKFHHKNKERNYER